MQITKLSLVLPGYEEISKPHGIYTGGLGSTGGKVISRGITIFLVVAVIMALFFLIYGGIQWIMSEGDKSKVQAARNKVMYAVIGLVVIFLAFFIVNVVGNLFSINFSTFGR